MKTAKLILVAIILGLMASCSDDGIPERCNYYEIEFHFYDKWDYNLAQTFNPLTDMEKVERRWYTGKTKPLPCSGKFMDRKIFNRNDGSGDDYVVVFWEKE